LVFNFRFSADLQAPPPFVQTLMRQRVRVSQTLTLICLAETIFWIAVLSSASALADANQVQEYLVREQGNHQALASLRILKDIEPAFAVLIELEQLAERQKSKSKQLLSPNPSQAAPRIDQNRPPDPRSLQRSIGFEETESNSPSKGEAFDLDA